MEREFVRVESSHIYPLFAVSPSVSLIAMGNVQVASALQAKACFDARDGTNVGDDCMVDDCMVIKEPWPIC